MRPRIGPRKTNVHRLYIWKGCDFSLSLLFPVRRRQLRKKHLLLLLRFLLKCLRIFSNRFFLSECGFACFQYCGVRTAVEKNPFISSQNMTTVILHAVWQAVSLKGLSYIICIQCFVLGEDWRFEKKFTPLMVTNNILIALIGEMTENCFFFFYV